MRLVVALGGNALLERGEHPDASVQTRHVTTAVRALVPLASSNDLVVTHGNGPQVGLLALESAQDPSLTRPYPFDILGAQTQGMIGYLLLQGLENGLPGREVVALVNQTRVDPDDPAFGAPSKFVGPVYGESEAHQLARARGWSIRRDGDAWRRVVASPDPKEIVELGAIRSLVATGTVVVCAGGGGVPVIRGADGTLRGVEAVVDKDLTASRLAREIGADALMMLTDVDAVLADFGTDHARPLRRARPDDLRSQQFAAGSMGPKVEAACRFVTETGRPAMIGHLRDAGAVLSGQKGTMVVPSSAAETVPAEKPAKQMAG
jgi:carbamate kinase